MPARDVQQRFQLVLAVVVLALSAALILWVLSRLARKAVGPRYMDFNIIVGATGCCLGVLKYLASPETRHELEALSTVGNVMWLGSCALTVFLHRIELRRDRAQRPHD